MHDVCVDLSPNIATTNHQNAFPVSRDSWSYLPGLCRQAEVSDSVLVGVEPPGDPSPLRIHQLTPNKEQLPRSRRNQLRWSCNAPQHSTAQHSTAHHTTAHHMRKVRMMGNGFLQWVLFISGQLAHSPRSL